MGNSSYPTLETESPRDDFIYTELDAHIDDDFTPESIGNFLYSSIHQGPYSFEEALHILAESDFHNYENQSDMFRENDEIPDSMLPSGINYNQLLEDLPPHLVCFNPEENSPEGYKPETEYPSSFIVHSRYDNAEQEREMRRNVSEGIEKMVELATLSDQDVIELKHSHPPERLGQPIETGIIGNPEFSKSAWENFRNNNWEIHEEVEEMLETYSNDKYDTLRRGLDENHEGLQRLSNLNKEVLSSLFGDTIPLRRGLPLDSLSRHTEEYRNLDYKEDIQGKNEFEEQLRENGVTIQRESIDSWTSSSPNWFATPTDDIYSRGVILHRNTPIEEIAFSSLTSPQLDDSEYLVESGEITFEPSQISFVDHPEQHFFEQQMIWTYENRP